MIMLLIKMVSDNRSEEGNDDLEGTYFLNYC